MYQVRSHLHEQEDVALSKLGKEEGMQSQRQKAGAGEEAVLTDGTAACRAHGEPVADDTGWAKPEALSLTLLLFVPRVPTGKRRALAR